MHSLRSLAAQRPSLLHAARFDDEWILRLIAPLLSDGSLHAHRILRKTGQGRNSQDVSASVQAVSAAARPSRSVDSVRPVTPKPEAAEADAFSAATDAQATAAVLREASEAGTPFSEVCAKPSASR